MASDEAGHLEKRLLDRQLFFTDAVFAIVLTILVLELKPPIGLPPDQEAEGLRHMLSHLGSFAFSFAVISVFWFAHMSTTSVQRRFDWWAALANLAFLFPICLIPFVSAWLGGGLGDLYTWRIYCWTLVATSVANVVLVLVASRGGGRLIGGVTRRQRVHRALRAASPGIAFSGGLILLSFDQLLLSQYIWLSIPVILFLERRVYPAEPSVDPADLPDAPKPRRARRKAA
ncbi:MAG: TMEM175 family protein [Phenylobacterium sp.]